MKAQYFIHHDGVKEGPYDLLIMMKRIKNGKVLAESLVSTETMDVPMPALRLQDLSMFFDQDNSGDIEPVQAIRQKRSFSQMLGVGWRFVSTYQSMSVFSGSMVLITFLLALPLQALFGLGTAIMLASLIFFNLQSIYMICALRLNRGQHINAVFLKQAVIANLIPLVLGSCFMAVLFWVGLFFLILPGVIMFSVYVFVPLLISDRGFGVIEAMEASRMLIARNNSAYFPTVIGLVLMHLLACVSIILIPLTLPILAGPLADLYDELSHKHNN